MIRPCASCPWRVSTRTEDIPGGGMDHELARAATPGPGGWCDVVMACHLTTDEAPRACVGWALQVAKPLAHASGPVALPMRLLLITGGVDLTRFGTDAPLHPDMASMLAAHRDRR